MKESALTKGKTRSHSERHDNRESAWYKKEPKEEKDQKKTNTFSFEKEAATGQERVRLQRRQIKVSIKKGACWLGSSTLKQIYQKQKQKPIK